jgi:PIN domain nuclease of toxin-antitoxin system
LDLEAGRRRLAVRAATAQVILLDTNAVIWLDQNHRRARPLGQTATPLAISPATLLELQFLVELRRIRLPRGGLEAITADDRWTVDEPPVLDWFAGAAEESWTRDPFDRLIVAHARLRGCRLATGDKMLLDHLRPAERLEL